VSTDIERIRHLMRHIHNVQENCVLLAEKMIANGEFKLARQLIANGLIHDQSKMSGIEFDNLTGDNSDKLLLVAAIKQHNSTNDHHPEFWDKGIHGMPKVYVAEMICDWKARSSEMGTDLREWLNGEAMKRFVFTKDDSIYKTMMEFVDMLLIPAFKPVSEIR